jgi:hypothetical protein
MFLFPRTDEACYRSRGQRPGVIKMMKLIRPPTISICFLLVLTACGTARTQTRNARVVSPNATLRETPSNTGSAEGEIPEGILVKILDEKSPWFVVRVGDRVGWMHAATLRVMDNATTRTQERQSVTATSSDTPSPAETPSPEPTRSTAGRNYIRGPRGGCYYMSSSGSKVYVDRSMCN